MTFREGWNREYYNAIRAYIRRENLGSFYQAFRVMQKALGRKSDKAFYEYLYNRKRPVADDRFRIAKLLGRRPEKLWPPKED